MISLQLPHRILKTFVASVTPVATEAHLHLDPTGLKITTIDHNNVALVIAHLPLPPEQPIFHRYDINKALTVGMDLTGLMGMLALLSEDASPSTLVELRLDGNSPKVMEVNFGRYRCNLGLPDMNTLRREPHPPEVLWTQTGRATLRGDLLGEALRAATSLSDKVDIGLERPKVATDPPLLFLESVDEAGGKNRIRFEVRGSPNSLTEATAWRANDERSRFIADYLKEMIKRDGPMASASLVYLHLSTDQPLRLEFDIPGGHVMYALAPRIEVD